MKRKVISLSYFFNENSDINKEIFTKWEFNEEFFDNYNYCFHVYSLNSFLINLYVYRHLYYALNLESFSRDKIILDLGCADGPFLPSLNFYGKRVIGLDLSLSWLQRARKLINCKKYPLNKVILLNAEGHYLPFKDNSIDLVYCLETLEHIPNSMDLINEIYRILKDKGTLIYSLPIEIGFSLFIRQLVGKITKFPREPYSLRDLIKNGLLKKPSKRINNPINHKNFDWRILYGIIIKRFKQVDIKFSPLPFLKVLNPTVIFKVKKIIN